MRCVDEGQATGIWLLDDLVPGLPLSWVALIVGGLVVLIPVFLAGWLVHYRQHDFFSKKYPTGRVTAENIKPEGERLGERLSQLDDKWHLKAFGFFYSGACRC